MAKRENQKLKILYLQKILLEQTDPEHPISLPDLIAALDAYGISAERKSVYADLNALEEFGMHIEKTAAGHGGYYVDSREFELPELKLLVDAVQSSRFITRKKSAELIRKLETLTGVHQAKSLQRQVYVSNRVKTENESIYYAVDSLHDAIAQNRNVTFLYYDWNLRRERVARHDGERYEVSPYAMTWADENYYLIAYDLRAGAVRHYRVDKMGQVEITDRARSGADRLPDFDAALYARRVFGMFGGQAVTVCLQCDSSLCGVILDRFGTDVTLIPNDGGFSVAVNVVPSHVFFGWVAGFSGKVYPTSPADTVREYREFLQKLLTSLPAPPNGASASGQTEATPAP